ncbi:hypothetical protein B5C34_06965 [Pacificimonas flava]|uniref:DUF2065 domain-containing protein n=2 Tax=Pacificimonas TaxID=1960290 RepID=A0A219B4V5_9SPHN|nr:MULTISPECIES: DUF2065 domain-containing protein [Pacificimonas]MBZ6377035.1 DUF2065 domain-containing protein [Pacificimonas aurantium]OWV33224.1 hypothetical protein B5C34_06965 [Pacificimonas flava]
MNLVVAIGLALALEGAAYALFPDAMRRAATALFSMGEREVRIAGAVAFGIGAAITLAALASA